MEDLSVDDQAATKVQTLYRGHAARKKTEQLKYGVARKNVNEYLQKHKIHDLLQHLVSLVAYHRPDDPKLYLQNEIATLQAAYGRPSRVHTTSLSHPLPLQSHQPSSLIENRIKENKIKQTGTRQTSLRTTISTPCSA
eukprot:Rhum_TRINITY_DN9223_c0_g1::Rhum_TRINITY_DN9223_c0_g1_i1::g.32335::m.32335